MCVLSVQVLIKQEIQRKSGYAIQVDEEHLRVQLDTIQSELNAPTQFKVSFLGALPYPNPQPKLTHETLERTTCLQNASTFS